MMSPDVAHALVHHWFDTWTDDEALPDGDRCMGLWWSKNEAVDQDLRERFGVAHFAEAAELEAPDLLTDPVRAVARVLLLDQVPRNIFRGTCHMFATDRLAQATTARIVADEAFFGALPRIHRYFVLMPWMHSEEPSTHDRAVVAFTALAQDGSSCPRAGVYEMARDYEMKHQAIVDRFGRYPHRNGLMGRVSTAAEVAFLSEPGSSF